MLWVGTDDGLIQLTRDDGGSWTQRHAARHAAMEHDQHDRALALRCRHRLCRRRPPQARRHHAVRLHDRRRRQDLDAHRRGPAGRRRSCTRCARTRSSAACCMPAPRPACSSPSTTADTGRACSSTCRARRCTTWSVKDDDLVVATHGRSFWILDDVTPLRQVAAAAAAATAYLYTPETGYRLYYPDQVDTHPPVGPEPARRRAHRLLPAGDARAARSRIDILDAQRRRGAPPDQRQGGQARRAAAGVARPGASGGDAARRVQGMNRFVWNLRYDDPVQIPDAFYAGLPPRGPIVLPGAYTVQAQLCRPDCRRRRSRIAPDPRDQGLARRAAAEIRAVAWRSTTTRMRCIAR